MANTGFKGILNWQTGTVIVVPFYFVDSAGNVVTTATTKTFSILELQSDGSFKTFDFNNNTFTAGAVTTPTGTLTYQKANNNTLDTGLWVALQTTLTNFTVGAKYLLIANNSTASPSQQVRMAVYGSAEGDLTTLSYGTGTSYLESHLRSSLMSMGSVWLNTAGANAGATAWTDGTADNPVNSMANAITVLTATGLKKLHAESGNTITLAASFPYHLIGDNYTLALGSQDISNAIFENFGPVSGIATAPSGPPIFNGGPIGSVTLPGCTILNGGFTGTFTAPIAGGNYVFRNCIAQGSTVPVFNFSAVTSTTKIDCRDYSGGGTWTTNTNCTLTIETVDGGTHTVTTGGGNVNIYGNIRNIVITVSGSETVNIHGTIGTITLNGTAVAALVNISGTHGSITNTSTNCTVNDLTGDTPGTTTLLSRLTSSRSTYLDNLNVGGNVASHADITAINQSASKHLTLVSVNQFAPSQVYTIDCRTYNALTGGAVNADTNPTLTVTGSISGSLLVNVTGPTNPETGLYRWTYTVPATPTLEQLLIGVSATISTVTYTLSTYTQTVDSPTAVFTSTDKSNLTTIFNKLPATTIADATILGTPIQAGPVTLTSAYDATKTAAQVGSQMDFVNAPNATALTAIGAANWSSSSRTLTSFGFTVAANITQILGSALSGTAASIAAAFSYYFNISPPSHTINDSGASATDIANALFVNGTTNKLQVNTDNTVNAGNLNANIKILSPLSPSGTRMYITKGDDYAVSNGQSLEFQITNQIALIGTVAHLRFEGEVVDACMSSTIVNATQVVVMGDMLAAFTSTLSVSSALKYQLRFTIGGLTTTILNGTATVVEGL